jgi:hypothetical protein
VLELQASASEDLKFVFVSSIDFFVYVLASFNLNWQFKHASELDLWFLVV